MRNKIKTIDYRFRNYISGHGVDLGDRLDPDEEDNDLDLPLQKLPLQKLLTIDSFSQVDFWFYEN